MRRDDGNTPCKCERDVPSERERIGDEEVITLSDEPLRRAVRPQSFKGACRERDEERAFARD